MSIPELTAQVIPEKKRTAIYLDRSLADTIREFAAANGVSANRAMVYLLQRGLEAATEDQA